MMDDKEFSFEELKREYAAWRKISKEFEDVKMRELKAFEKLKDKFGYKYGATRKIVTNDLLLKIAAAVVDM